MNYRFHISISKIFYGIVAFLSCWYFYFASSFKLRPYPSLFWIAMAALSILMAFIHRTRLNKIDIAYLLGMIFLIGLSLSSVNPIASIGVLANYIIYYLVARFITKNCDGEKIHSIILFFSIIHLVCLYMQVIFPDLYTRVVLPLLSDSIHTEVIEQMNWNKAYYGFSMQTSMCAMYLSIGAVLSAVRAKNEQKTTKKMFYIILVALFLMGTFFTQRRGSSAAALVIIALIYMRTKGNKISKILFGIAIVVMIAVIGIQNIPGMSGIINKMSKFASSGSLMNGRDDFFGRAVHAIMQKPLFGWGAGQVEAAIGYAWLENSFLSILVQLGVIGFVIFYFPLVKLMKNVIVNERVKTDNIIDFSFYIQILFLIMSFIENYYGEAQHIFIFFVIVLAQRRYVNTNIMESKYENE